MIAARTAPLQLRVQAQRRQQLLRQPHRLLRAAAAQLQAVRAKIGACACLLLPMHNVRCSYWEQAWPDSLLQGHPESSST